MGEIGGDETLPARGAAPDAGCSLAIGTLVEDRYRIVRRLGEGGMGEVYAAEDLILATTVALKTIRPELEGSTIALERFRREMQLARKVTNAHVCRLHDVGEHEGRVFLTMEMLEGETLASRIASGPLAIADVERLAPQLVEGLAALHAAGVVHRDFKPSNVMLVGDRAVITDFGLARSVVERDIALTAQTGMLGTPAYMAPEQVEGRAVTPATDVYALGVVLYELVAGELPFREDTALATATARLHTTPPLASSRASAARLAKADRARWDTIVGRCLQRDPANRPQIDRVLDVPRQLISRRWFLAGSAATIGAGAAGWRWLAADAPQAIATTAGDLVAVIPVDGAGDLLADPLRVALTVDIHDALSTTGLPHLALDLHPIFETLNGSAVQLSRDPDPSAAAWKIDRVAAVVRMSIGWRTQNAPLAVDVVIERRATPRWKRRFERPAREALLLVHDLATAVALELGRPMPRRFLDVRPLDPPAYAAYGAALATLLRAPVEATAFDPAATDALAAVFAANATLLRAGARVALRLAEIGQVRETGNLPITAEAIRISDQILAADPNQPIALAARGIAASTMYDWKTVERTLPRALELAPTLDRVEQERQRYLLLQGKFDEHERLGEAHRARNPLAKGQLLGPVYSFYYSRQYREEIRYIESILDDVPRNQRELPLSMLAVAYASTTRFDKAVAIANQLEDSENPYAQANCVVAYALAGQRDKAIALRKKIPAGAAPGSAAMMDDALGNIDDALEHLEKVVAAHYTEALYIKITPFSSALRSQPRFQALMKTVGL